jgi:colanic acid/amylovoran biosynthesis glycosyltransferase
MIPIRWRKDTIPTEPKTTDVTVLHSVLSWLPQTANWLYTQLVQLPRSIESHVVCESTQNLEQFSVPYIHSFEQLPRWRAWGDAQLRRWGLRQHLGLLTSQARICQAQILHSHFGNMGWKNSREARRLGLKHVVTFYGYDVSYLPLADPRWAKRYLELFERVDRVLCEGPHMAKCIVALGCPENKVSVHHLGVRLDRIAFHPRSWRPGETLRVLIAASFKEKKGIPYADPESAGSVEEKRVILELIDKHALGRKTRLLGYQPMSIMLDQARRNHVFLSPSVTARSGDTEGGAPVSIIEMAASGMPIVSTVHCDIPEVIENGVTGLLAPERDVDALVAHLSWLLRNPERWPAMLAAARASLEARYDARVQGQKLAAVYRELVDS